MRHTSTQTVDTIQGQEVVLMGTIRKKLKPSSGFTLAETLLAILILLLVTSIVAAGIPVARTAYERVVVASNADALLSTTISALRNELGAAKIIKPVENAAGAAGTTVSYYSGAASYNASTGRYMTSGNRCVICLNADSELSDYKSLTDPDRCIMLQRYAPMDNVDYSPALKTKMQAVRLVSKAASNKNLYVTYDSVSYADGILTFTGLKVCRDTDTAAANPLSQRDTLCIRVLSY